MTRRKVMRKKQRVKLLTLGFEGVLRRFRGRILQTSACLSFLRLFLVTFPLAASLYSLTLDHKPSH